MVCRSENHQFIVEQDMFELQKIHVTSCCEAGSASKSRRRHVLCTQGMRSRNCLRVGILFPRTVEGGSDVEFY